MADKSATGGSSGSVPELVSGAAARRWQIPKVATYILAALVGAAAAALIASFAHRGHRGRRRRPRPWHRTLRTAAVPRPEPENGRVVPQDAEARRLS
ncbi:hypothetical protein LUW76_13310 [Actinomadura madurae]|uniref:hypothetical protein n=1 Tax=Actinomadura madurae TaxID=1993 RepID=UPI00202675C2|nr:hypothetical protein [Actinomadura madurae]URM95211.1 hypothetical protein LUW76_13310 [Actinomadura madurae]URN05921.1 hypothetical protein LUW74_23180 [Actinomadura madurae]